MLTSSATTAQIIARVVAAAVLVMVGGLLLISTIPAALGWRSTVVLSGSMMPRIAPGDVVSSSPFDQQLLQPGQIILVKNPTQPDQLLMHRFVGRDEKGRLITRGDANREDDSSPVPPEAFVGLPRLRVPWVGLPSLWLREQRRLQLGVLALGLVGACALATGLRPAGGRVAS